MGFQLYTDGGSRGNPGVAGIGFSLVEGDSEIVGGGAYVGECTNNVAEYFALIWGLENAQALGVTDIEIFADSLLMVKQLNGQFKVKAENLKPLFARARDLTRQFSTCTAQHVYRENNTVADKYANEAMDALSEVGNAKISAGNLVQDAGNIDTIVDSLKFEKNGKSRNTETKPVEALLASNDQISIFDYHEERQIKDLERNIIIETSGMSDVRGEYFLTVKSHFDAAHSLYDYPGQCANLHGHTWDVEVTVASFDLDDIGIVYDFKNLKEDLAAVLKAYDHKNINDVKPFDTLSPTAENLARIIATNLAITVDARVRIVEVAVWESPIARVAYRPR